MLCLYYKRYFVQVHIELLKYFYDQIVKICVIKRTIDIALINRDFLVVIHKNNRLYVGTRTMIYFNKEILMYGVNFFEIINEEVLIITNEQKIFYYIHIKGIFK